MEIFDILIAFTVFKLSLLAKTWFTDKATIFVVTMDFIEIFVVLVFFAFQSYLHAIDDSQIGQN